jgi:hypothetical protein
LEGIQAVNRVPTEVVDSIAKQLDIADPSCAKAYVEREKVSCRPA